VNRAWEEKGFIYRAGLGVVITHPETTIRGLSHPQDGGIYDGYYLSDPTVQGAVENRFHIWRWLTASLEAKLTASYARIPVEGGHADVPNVAVHGLFGLGVELQIGHAIALFHPVKDRCLHGVPVSSPHSPSNLHAPHGIGLKSK
jgi:hypothetical protein